MIHLHQMTPAHLVSNLLMFYGVLANGMLWALGLAPDITHISPEAASTAGASAVWVALMGLGVHLIDGYIASRKSRLELDFKLEEMRITADARYAQQDSDTAKRLAESQLEALKLVMEAKATADSEIAKAKAQADSEVARAKLQASEEVARAKLDADGVIAGLEGQLARARSDRSNQAVGLAIVAADLGLDLPAAANQIKP